MRHVIVLWCAFAAAMIGFVAVMATVRPWRRQVFPQAGSGATRLVLRAISLCLCCAVFILCIVNWGVAVGLIGGIGIISIAGVVSVLASPFFGRLFSRH